MPVWSEQYGKRSRERFGPGLGQMLKRIYIETTIPSSYYTLRTDEGSLARQQVTRQWWEEYADRSILTSSAAVFEELVRGTGEIIQARLDLLEGVELLPITNRIEQIEQVYIEKLVMPKNLGQDAQHLAIASFHKVDVLLTWNLAHIANPNKLISSLGLIGNLAYQHLN